MNVTSVTNLTVDEYLDLYLMAKQMGDEKWQQEILAALGDFDLTSYEIQRAIQQLSLQYEEVKVNLATAAKAFLAEPK